MPKKVLHYTSAILNDRIITACGRDGLIREEGLIHVWHCAQHNVEVEIQSTIDGKRVTCKGCIRRLT
jgi:hypothetical protein